MYTVPLAGKSPNIRSYTVCIYTVNMPTQPYKQTTAHTKLPVARGVVISCGGAAAEVGGHGGDEAHVGRHRGGAHVRSRGADVDGS